MEKELDTLLDELTEKFSELENAIKELKGSHTSLRAPDYKNGYGIWIEYHGDNENICDKWFSDSLDCRPLPIVYPSYKMAEEAKERLQLSPDYKSLVYSLATIDWRYRLAEKMGADFNYEQALRIGGLYVRPAGSIPNVVPSKKDLVILLLIAGDRDIIGLKFANDPCFVANSHDLVARVGEVFYPHHDVSSVESHINMVVTIAAKEDNYRILKGA